MTNKRQAIFWSWFLEGMRPGFKPRKEDVAPWYMVMCLTGLDYFGSLGYAPGIAALAAGCLAPSATLVLVFLTLFGALPMYKKVAEKSPHGQGSIAMLASLVPGWSGKAVILCLMGFAATDFIITITLTAADASSHIIENNFVREFCQQHHNFSFLRDRIGLTYSLLAILSLVFLIGFKEAILVAVVVVALYLLLNMGVVLVGIQEIARNPELLNGWVGKMFSQYNNSWNIGLHSLILFPQLALGLSGFETGVAVMPLVEGRKGDEDSHPLGRIDNTKKLLTVAALIMSSFLLLSSLISIMLIPEHEFKEGGLANGRALAYIAHHYLGSVFGSVYDFSTILILWFSGASALAGLLSLVPRYLPRFGMAPEWARATRPLVLFFAAVSFAVTWYFKANVDAQGGAYATGVLVLMTSASVAVFLSLPRTAWNQRLLYAVISVLFGYTTIMNIVQRPEGLHIASFFILCIFVISFISRTTRATELRTRRVRFEDGAAALIGQYKGKPLHVVAHKPGLHDYKQKNEEARELHSIEAAEIVFLEIEIGDASDFTDDELVVTLKSEEGENILRCRSAAVPNAIALIMLSIRNLTACVPHAYLYWTEGNPLFYALKFLFLGEGETAPVTREILRKVEPDPKRRPKIHVV